MATLGVDIGRISSNLRAGKLQIGADRMGFDGDKKARQKWTSPQIHFA
jgi:hypothetical protein